MESKFPILEELKRKTRQNPFPVEYRIEANGWVATGTIVYDPRKEASFWAALQMTVESVVNSSDGTRSVVSEAYKSGYSRYLRPVALEVEDPLEKQDRTICGECLRFSNGKCNEATLSQADFPNCFLKK